jgi:hypothetical protein
MSYAQGLHAQVDKKGKKEEKGNNAALNATVPRLLLWRALCMGAKFVPLFLPDFGATDR